MTVMPGSASMRNKKEVICRQRSRRMTRQRRAVLGKLAGATGYFPCARLHQQYRITKCLYEDLAQIGAMVQIAGWHGGCSNGQPQDEQDQGKPYAGRLPSWAEPSAYAVWTVAGRNAVGDA